MEYPIPEDLKERHTQLNTWMRGPVPEGMEMPEWCCNKEELDLIERIARLEQELAEANAEIIRLNRQLNPGATSSSPTPSSLSC